MKKLIFTCVLLTALTSFLCADPSSEVCFGAAVPYYHLTLDGDGIKNDRSNPKAYDLNLQYRYIPLSGTCYMVDLGIGVFINESDYIEKYVGNDTAMLDLNFMVGMGWNVFPGNAFSRLIIGPVIGFASNSYTSDPVYRKNNTEKVTYEFDVGNIFAGIDVYFSHYISSSFGFFIDAAVYAGIGVATYTKKTETKGSNNAWSREETSDQKPTSYVWTIQPRAGFIIGL